ncbi:hypothetical protein TSUD_323830 [Trifolium subterraneum]|uniref:Xylanase inhibitor N-terminal domain-containing protein n=1 Tax=Trifolium subterraneum TaxID=3900 RepID=A0A2Z6NYP1_TRISU|nr:hypothetical protein TSUD_323830 [Trifolium subterraneum]
MDYFRIYFTKVKLGTTQVEFYVNIDTGSDILRFTEQYDQYHPQSIVLTKGATLESIMVSTISVLTTSTIEWCSNQRTGYFAKFEKALDGVFEFGHHEISVISQLFTQWVTPRVFTHCLRGDMNGEGALVLGEIVEPDIVYTSLVPSLLLFLGEFLSLKWCSNQRTGYFAKSEKALDGVFGFGHQEISMISRLSAQGVTPRVFSHCLRGDINGGGVLVLGEIVEPNIFYTPLVPSQCINQRTGYFAKSEKTLDGGFGFGRQEISVISQLSALRVTSRVFSHCLRGDINGG